MVGNTRPIAADPPTSRFVPAARACFARLGVERTRMEDIAREAGVSRQYLHRIVGGRDVLVEQAMFERCGELTAELEAQVDAAAPDVREAIADQVLAGPRLALADQEFVALSGALPNPRVNELLTSPESPIHEMNRRAFAALFARALGEGVLRTDVSPDAMVTWLQAVMALLATRDHLAEEETRQMVRDFVIPGLLIDI